MNILVVGCGSIGERHIRNLIDISNRNVIAFDTSNERLDVIKERFNVVTCTNIEQCYDCGIDAITLPVIKGNVRHAWHLYTILLDGSIDRDEFFKYMRSANIGLNLITFLCTGTVIMWRILVLMRRSSLWQRMCEQQVEDMVTSISQAIEHL